jgi:hypothetical protein
LSLSAAKLHWPAVQIKIGLLSAAAVGLGTEMTDRLLDEYAKIALANAASANEYEKSRRGDWDTYDPEITIWIAFKAIGDIGQNDPKLLQRLARLCLDRGCTEATRGLVNASTMDGLIWSALAKSAAAGDFWSIEAIGKSGHPDSASVLRQAVGAPLLDELAGTRLAAAIAHCGGDQAGETLTQLWARKEMSWGDGTKAALAYAFADAGYKPALAILGKLSDTFPLSYPYCLVGNYKPELVTAVTFASAQLGSKLARDTVETTLRHPVQEESIGTGSRYTIRHSPQVLYRAALAAAAYDEPEFVTSLVLLLRHENALVRLGAVKALSNYYNRHYAKGFKALFGDRDPDVREAAKRAQAGEILVPPHSDQPQ